MRRFLLDTNVVSELRKPKPHGAVSSWFNTLAPDQISVSAVVLGELQAGVETTRIQDAQKAHEIEEWIDRILATHSVLAMDGPCFREYARLTHRLSDTLREDAMIAATARVHGLTIATRNERDFRSFSVPVFNPFRFTG